MSESNNTELEQFRRKWQAEVSSRQRRTSRATAGNAANFRESDATEDPSKYSETAPNLTTAAARDGYHDGWLQGGQYDFDDLEAREEARKLGTSGTGLHPESQKQPETALEHFERAVEKEGQGNMQESLLHYRRAYKLDDRVDRAYRNKHFPPNKFQSKPANVNPSNAPVTVPNTAHHSLYGSGSQLSELVSSFAGTTIQPVVPEVEGDPQQPCPISTVPTEILNLIMNRTAMKDVASFMRLSRVCKHFAYLTLAEDSIWRDVCSRSKYGFKDMKYDFTMTVRWTSLPRSVGDDLPDLGSLSISEDVDASEVRNQSVMPALTPVYSSYLETFASRPRIRFSGVYISTVNYIRAGAMGANSVYWGNSPVHMITYYRYLRFYRDGSAVSLLTFFEPHDVVPLLSKENLLTARKSKDTAPTGLAAVGASVAGVAGPTQPTVQPPTMTAVMREARKARWRISPLQSAAEKVAEGVESEGNVYVESEGPTPNYTYHLQLALRSVRAASAAKNTKLVWRSFWSYNAITDDWGEFALKNDKAFVFSRVKSWADA